MFVGGGGGLVNEIIKKWKKKQIVLSCWVCVCGKIVKKYDKIMQISK